MSPKKHKLAVSISDDYCLLGIVTDVPDYKLCWLINEHQSASFVKVNDLQLYNKKSDQVQDHSLFQFDDENSMLTYRLITNRSENGYFISNLKNIDYLLHIQGDFITSEIENVVRSLNKLDEIRMCVPIDLNKITDKAPLRMW